MSSAALRPGITQGVYPERDDSREGRLERFFHAFAGHLCNAFYIFMKSRTVRVLFRMVFPLLVGLDNFLCRYRRFNKYAEEGMWFLKARRVT